MDPLTVTTGTFTLTQGVTPVSGVVNFLGLTATFNPDVDLAYSTNYTATITTGVTDLASNHLAVAKVWSFTTGTALPANPTAPLGTSGPLAGTVLGEASRFVIIGHAAVTATPGGGTHVSNGDMGLIGIARSAYTGFTDVGGDGHFAELTNGLSYAPDDVPPFITPAGYATTLAFLTQVDSDLTYAYNYLNATNPTAPTQSCPIELGGKTLTRGVYNTGASVLISTGDLHLDAQGDPNSVWIFQIGINLTTVSPGLKIWLDNGALAKNVYFVTGGYTAIGAGMEFYGNVLAGSQVTVGAGAHLTGRFIGMTAGVTFIDDTVTKAP
jgi:hypothetical protein